jgi:hypothetical protein
MQHAPPQNKLTGQKERKLGSQARADGSIPSMPTSHEQHHDDTVVIDTRRQTCANV